MSSASESTVGTPSKPPSNGNSNGPRTPLPGGPSNGAPKTTMIPPKNIAPDAVSEREIQVPSSIPPPGPQAIPTNPPAKVDTHETQQPDETDEEDEEDEDEEDEDQGLAKFDWGDFEQRYTETLKKQHEEEVEIIDEFDLYATVCIRCPFVTEYIILTQSIVFHGLGSSCCSAS